MRAGRKLSARTMIWCVAISALAGGLISCTYIWRRAYVITDAQEQITAGGWTFHPRIISSETRSKGKQPDAPEEFVLSFVAVHPRTTSMYDVMLDSFTLVYPPTYRAETVVPNEATFISYYEISPDSVVKRFSLVDPLSHKLVWRKYDSSVGGLLVTLFVRLIPGNLGTQTGSERTIVLDTIVAGTADHQAIDTTLSTFLVRKEITLSRPGLPSQD